MTATFLSSLLNEPRGLRLSPYHAGSGQSRANGSGCSLYQHPGHTLPEGTVAASLEQRRTSCGVEAIYLPSQCVSSQIAKPGVHLPVLWRRENGTMRLPSRGGPINHTEKGDFRSPGGLHVERLTRKVRMVKTPRKPASAVQQLHMFPGDLALPGNPPSPTLVALGILPKAKQVNSPQQVRGRHDLEQRLYAAAHRTDPRHRERHDMALHQIRRCRTCKVVKPYSEFSCTPSGKTIDRVANECKDCMLTRKRDNYMHRKYGITLEEYATLYEAQADCCAICSATGKSAATEQSDHSKHGSHSGVLVVDHCHTTGQARALLCAPCNWGLGHFRDDTTVLRKAIAYLETHAISDVRVQPMRSGVECLAAAAKS